MTLTKITDGPTEVHAGEYSPQEFAIRIKRKHLAETVELAYDEAAQLFDLLGAWLESEDLEVPLEDYEEMEFEDG